MSLPSSLLQVGPAQPTWDDTWSIPSFEFCQFNNVIPGDYAGSTQADGCQPRLLGLPECRNALPSHPHPAALELLLHAPGWTMASVFLPLQRTLSKKLGGLMKCSEVGQEAPEAQARTMVLLMPSWLDCEDVELGPASCSDQFMHGKPLAIRSRLARINQNVQVGNKTVLSS